MIGRVSGSALGAVLLYFMFYDRLPAVLLLAVSLLFLLGGILGGLHHSHGGLLSIDLHAQRSRLGGYHAGLKVLVATAAAFTCVAANSLCVSVFVFLFMSGVTVLVGKTSFHYYLSLLTLPGFFILMGTAAILFQFSGTPAGVFAAGTGAVYICVTAASQSRALSVMCNAFGAVSCLYMLSLSTPMHKIIGVLRRARVPKVMVELMVLIYRYLFVLLETNSHMVNAAASRLGYRDYPTSVKTALRGSRNLLFLSFRRSSDCFAALEARCYNGEIRFLDKAQALGRGEAAAAVGFGAILAALCHLTGGVHL